MTRDWRSWFAGFGVVGVLALAYVVATPTGRALRLAVGGVPVGTPQAEVEARIRGACDDGVRTVTHVCVTFPRDPEGIRLMQEDARAKMEAGTTASDRYWGPLFAVEFDFAGWETSRLVAARVVPQVRAMGVVNALGVMLLGVGLGVLFRRRRPSRATPA